MKFKLFLIALIQIGTLCVSQQQAGTKPVTFVNPKGPNTDYAKLTYGNFPQTPKPIGIAKAPVSFGSQPAPAAGGAKPPVSVGPAPTGTAPKPAILPTQNPASGPSYANAAAKPVAPTPAPSGSTTTKKPSLISDTELREFSEDLLSKDVNNLAKYVTVDLQGKIERNETNDKAPKPLITVKPEAYKVATVQKMQALFDNYVQSVAVSEDVTAQERKEEEDFLDAIIPTPTMQLAKKILTSKGLIKSDADFKDNLKRIWFTLYSREANKLGSSGFEHVFVSESVKGQITGFHNWIYFALEEQNKHADYQGYIRSVSLGDKGSLVKFRFKHNGQPKALTTMFIGTSPEFEIALYTVCYMFRADHHCPVKMNGVKFSTRTWDLKQRGVSTIGSAYPELS